jgi:hypothetical protein
VRPALIASICAYNGDVNEGCYEGQSLLEAARTLAEKWDIVFTERWFKVRFPQIYEPYESYKRLSELLDKSVEITAQRLRDDALKLSPYPWPDRAHRLRAIEHWRDDYVSNASGPTEDQMQPIEEPDGSQTFSFRFSCGIACQQLKDISGHGEGGWDRQERGRPERDTSCIRYTKGCD